MKCANQIFTLRQVNSSFTPDRTIDHRQQGGGHLYVTNAAQIRRGGIPAEVADHAAAHRDQHRLAIQPGLQSITVNLKQPVLGFAFFARRNHRSRIHQPLLHQTFLQAVRMQGVHPIIGHQHALGRV